MKNEGREKKQALIINGFDDIAGKEIGHGQDQVSDESEARLNPLRVIIEEVKLGRLDHIAGKVSGKSEVRLQWPVMDRLVEKQKQDPSQLDPAGEQERAKLWFEQSRQLREPLDLKLREPLDLEHILREPQRLKGHPLRPPPQLREPLDLKLREPLDLEHILRERQRLEGHPLRPPPQLLTWPRRLTKLLDWLVASDSRKSDTKLSTSMELLKFGDIVATRMTTLFPASVSQEDREGIVSTIYDTCQETFESGNVRQFQLTLTKEMVSLLFSVVWYRVEPLLPRRKIAP